MAADHQRAGHPVKLSCRHVWKLFGQEAETFLNGRTTPPNAEEAA